MPANQRGSVVNDVFHFQNFAHVRLIEPFFAPLYRTHLQSMPAPRGRKLRKQRGVPVERQGFEASKDVAWRHSPNASICVGGHEVQSYAGAQMMVYIARRKKVGGITVRNTLPPTPNHFFGPMP